MLKTYRIIPLVFILFLFGFTLITVSPVFAEEEKPTEETCKNLPVGHDMDACYSYFFGHTSCWKTCGPGEGIPLPSEMTQSAEEIACGKLKGRAQRICFEEIPCTTLIPNPFPGDIEACEKRKVEDKARGLERKRQAEQAAKEREAYPVGSREKDEKLAAEALANAKEEHGDEAEAAKARVKAEEDRLAAEAAAKAENDRLVAQQRREAADAAAQAEANRLAAEAAAEAAAQAQQAENDRLAANAAAEAAAKAENDRLIAEAAAKAEEVRLADEAAIKRGIEEDRLLAEADAKSAAESSRITLELRKREMEMATMVKGCETKGMMKDAYESQCKLAQISYGNACIKEAEEACLAAETTFNKEVLGCANCIIEVENCGRSETIKNEVVKNSTGGGGKFVEKRITYTPGKT